VSFAAWQVVNGQAAESVPALLPSCAEDLRRTVERMVSATDPGASTRFELILVAVPEGCADAWCRAVLPLLGARAVDPAADERPATLAPAPPDETPAAESRGATGRDGSPECSSPALPGRTSPQGAQRPAAPSFDLAAVVSDAMSRAVEPDGATRDEVARAVVRELWDRGLLLAPDDEWPPVHYCRSSLREIDVLLSEVESHEEPRALCEDCIEAVRQAREFAVRTLAETMPARTAEPPPGVVMTAAGLLALADREPDPRRAERLRLLAALKRTLALRLLRERGMLRDRSS
jgi:hypothetical protein